MKQTSLFDGPVRLPPLVVAYGVGVDSTAMLVGLHQRGQRPDAILFADVGGEKQETYDYLPIINAWLESVGFPTVTVVRYQAQNFKNYPPYVTLEQNCLTNGTLPSEAFGFGSCSQKWKAAPQKKWLQAWAPAVLTWAQGDKVRRAIGFDNSCSDQARRYRAETIVDERFEYWYPLQEWGWDREECKRQIAAAGLPVPAKSSCFFCPNMTPAEVSALPADNLRRIVLIESRAKPRLEKIQGLWRNGVKGVRDPSKARPGRMTDYIRDKGLLPAEEIASIEAGAPQELLNRAQSFANGMDIQSWDEVFAGLGAEETCTAV
jgi:hypothetical protein